MDYTYPANIRFDCIKCGLCCGDTTQKTRRILLLEEEAKAISAETSQPTQAFTTKTDANHPYIYEVKKTAEGKCIFLKNNQCTIYELRPLICCFYPFELKYENNKHAFDFTLECPAINQGKVTDQKYFDALFKLAQERLK